MPDLVKILSDNKGEVRDEYLLFWHLVDPCNPLGNATLCEGEFFVYGESGCEYDIKSTNKGGITCPMCLKYLKIYRAIKL